MEKIEITFFNLCHIRKTECGTDEPEIEIYQGIPEDVLKKIKKLFDKFSKLWSSMNIPEWSENIQQHFPLPVSYQKFLGNKGINCKHPLWILFCITYGWDGSWFNINYVRWSDDTTIKSEELKKMDL